ncbi:protein SSUH2 homolog [Halichondria panicea]|uniref:protein SSUH2 homolog n=1 Tax=Halichondria panicea TaxID=6063 RepID=UPI00312B2D27
MDNQPLLGPQYNQPQGGYSPPQAQQPTGPPAAGPPPGQNLPGEDVHENAGAEAPQPSAPDASKMDYVSGYDNVGFNTNADMNIPPPAYEQATAPEPDESRSMQPDIPTISEDEARDALLSEVEKHCCYGKKAARDLVFLNITPSSAFHYQLETFTEGRKTTWQHEPFAGQLIDGPQNGPAPGPWDIAAQPNQLFQDHEKHFEVPHTASVKVCHNCVGAGMTQCWRCRGRGRVICGSCDGSGHKLQPVVHHDHGHHHHGHGHGHGHGHHDHHGGSHVDMERVPCHQCNGTGKKRCWTCNGFGRIECSVCRAKCQLKWYIKLTVTWKTHKADHIVERTALPDHLIRAAEGKVAFQDQQPRVYHVYNFPDQAVNNASKQLVDSHATAFANEKILMQRQWIRIVPVSEARCDYKGKSFNYFVYGYNTLVHAPEYPQQMCCGCSIV